MSVEDPSSSQLIFDFPNPSNETFTSFIESESSKLALHAAKSLCTNPQISFHTLFIAGQSGLGKTHLLKAIWNYAQQNGENAYYIDGHHFVQSFCELGVDKVENTLNKILESDYFLLDDAHKISISSHAQEKLHYIFNQMNPNKKKIVFSATKTPCNLTGLEEFLKSRFQWGMIVQLKTIHDKTTAEIIYKIASDLGLEIPTSIISYVLNHISRDYPSILNAVNEINKASYLKKQKVTIPLVKNILGL